MNVTKFKLKLFKVSVRKDQNKKPKMSNEKGDRECNHTIQKILTLKETESMNAIQKIIQKPSAASGSMAASASSASATTSSMSDSLMSNYPNNIFCFKTINIDNFHINFF